MGLFYAYAKNINDDWSYRYLIVFASRSVADEWWRAVNGSGTAYATSVNRVTPQFYTHNPGTAIIANTVNDPKVASAFLNKVFFTLLNDRDGRILSIIPEQEYTDPASGNLFYIRSKVDPRDFWYTSDNYSISVSRERRTRFRITLRSDVNPKGTIMIASDDIYISIPGLNDTAVGIASDGSLTTAASGTATIFKFGDFNGSFKGQAGSLVIKTANGEAWELV
ncbi:hypothetical protein BOTBODRAFT_144598 [Botryobasidium botryosum FD-172 SS1]|uniref:Uncharacterized protein n=1 Tax=Botryobasidium botryosum (strain FD-172 SS1) TaxID=930990 RepID=A0A067MY98_BOTB1|nr:hypothetical protein BOTBODRAFT_144598 [Botryobasidium botryosum FD-172 SS1]